MLRPPLKRFSYIFQWDNRGALRNKTTTSENLGKATVEDRRGMIRMEQGQKLSKFKILLLEIVFKPVVGYVLLVCSILGFAASTWQSTVIAPFPDEDPDDPEFHAFNTYFYLAEGILNILMFIEPMLRLIALGIIHASLGFQYNFYLP